MNEETLKALLSLEVQAMGVDVLSQLGEAINHVAESLKGLTEKGGELTGIRKNMVDTGAAMTAVGGAMAGAALIGGEAIWGLVKQADEFETTILRVRENTTLTAQQTDQMAQSVLQLGMDTGSSFTDMANGFMYVTNQTNDAAHAMDILSVANQNAIATGDNVGQDAQLLAQVMHEYGLDVSKAATESQRNADITLNAAHAMGVLRVAAADANMTMDEFVTFGGETFAWASSIGVPLEQVAAAYATLSKHGMDAATAATQVKDMMMHLVKPSSAAEKALKSLGKTAGVDLTSDFSATGVATKGLDGVLGDVTSAMNKAGLSAAEQTSLWMNLVPNIRGGTAAFILAGGGAQDFANILGDVNNKQVTDTIVAQGYATAQENLGVQLNRLQRIVEGVAISLGMALEPAVRALVDIVGPVVEAVAKWAFNNAQLVSTIAEVVVGVSGVLGILLSFTGIALMAGVVLSPLSIILILLTGAVILFGEAWATNFAHIRDVLTPVIDTVSRFASSLTQAFSDIGSVLAGIVNTLRGNGLQGYIQMLTGLVGLFGVDKGNQFVAMLEHALQAVQRFASTVGQVFQSIISTVKNFFGSIGQAAQGFGVFNQYFDKLPAAVKPAAEAVGGVAQFIGSLVRNIADAVKGHVSLGQMFQNISSDAHQLLSHLTHAFTDGLVQLGQAIASAIKSLPSIAASIASWFRGELSKVPWKTIASSIDLTGIWNGLKTAVSGFSITDLVFGGLAQGGSGARTGGVVGIVNSLHDALTQAFGQIDWKSVVGSVNGLVDAFDKWVAGQDWSKIGHDVGHAAATAISSGLQGALDLAFGQGGVSIKGSVNPGEAVKSDLVDAIKSIDWYNVGTTVIPNLIAFLAGAINGMFDPSIWIPILQQHGLDIGIAIATIFFTPTKILGPVMDVLARIPLAGPILRWLIMGIHDLGGLRGPIEDGMRTIAQVFGDSFVEALVPEGSRIGEVVRGIGPLIRDALGSVGHFFADGWDTVRLYAMEGADSLGKALGQALRGILTGIGDLIKLGFEGLGKLLEPVWTLLRDNARQALDGLVSVARDSLTKLGSAFKSGADTIKNLLDPAWQAIKDTAQSIWDGISGFIGRAWNTIKTIVQTGANFVKNILDQAWSGLKATASQIWDGISQKISTVISGVKDVVSQGFDFVKQHVSTALDAVKSVVTTIWDFVKSKISTVLDAIKSNVSSIWDTIKSNISSALDTIKSDVTTAFDFVKTKISDDVNAAKDAAVNTFDKIKADVSTDVDRLKTNVLTAFDGLRDGVSKAINTAKDAVVGAVGTIGKTIDGLVGKINSAISSVTGLTSKLGNISVPGALGQIKSAIAGLHIPGLAAGTDFAAGGLTIVGENGPELVNLPRGSQVHPTDETQTMLSKIGQPQARLQAPTTGGSQSVTIQVTVQNGAVQVTSTHPQAAPSGDMVGQAIAQVLEALARSELRVSTAANVLLPGNPI